MARRHEPADWRVRWPELVVERRTETAVEYLQTYYRVHETGKPHYTGARFEDMAALNPDPNTLGPADFLAVTMLSVTVPAAASIRLLGPDAAAVSDLLAQIPTDVDLVDADPGLLESGSPADALWKLLRRDRDGLGPTTTSKLLAAKRPRLLPIWDSFVKTATGMGTVGYWSRFQHVLADDQRLLWDWLQGLPAHAPTAPSTISALRILDVLLWMSVDVTRRPSRPGPPAPTEPSQAPPG